MNYNPNESGKSQTANKTIVFLPNFVLADVTSGDNPGEIYNSKFSRVNISLLDYTNPEKKISVTSNIKIGEAWSGLVEAFRAATVAAATKAMMPANGNGDSDNSPAYKTTILCGTEKGKTPAQIIAEPNGEQKLTKLREFLMQNSTGRFASGNRSQIVAIDDAIGLLRNGKLKIDVPVPFPEIIIYDAPAHGNPYKRCKDKPNLYFCSDTRITYSIGKNYPVTITVSNYYAPIDRKENGQQLVRSKEAIDIRRVSMSISQAAFAGQIDSIARREQIFLAANAEIIQSAIVSADNEYRNTITQKSSYHEDGRTSDYEEIQHSEEIQKYEDGIFTLTNIQGVAHGESGEYIVIPCLDSNQASATLFLKDNDAWVQKFITATQTGSYPLRFRGIKKGNKYLLSERVS